MTCKIICTAEAEPNTFSRPASMDMPMRSVCRCDTHHMPMDGMVGANDLCPIGKIELATELALAAIQGQAIDIIQLAQATRPDGYDS